MDNEQACVNAAVSLYEELNPYLVDLGLHAIKPINHYCFRVELPRGGEDFDQISVSVPIGRGGNRGYAHGEGDPSTYELALVHEGEIVYHGDIGYDDVRSFYSVKELVSEFRRLILCCRTLENSFKNELKQSVDEYLRRYGRRMIHLVVNRNENGCFDVMKLAQQFV
jgi:hypothetical protein